MANANWSNPTLTSTYNGFLSEVKNRDEDLALQFDGTTSTNIPTNTIRWDSSANRWKKWNGSAWVELASTYALTGLSTTGNASIGGALSVTGSATVTGGCNIYGYVALQAGGKSQTPAADNNTTNIATTAFVVGQAATAAPVADGTATIGTSLRYARQDHVHPTDTTRAPLASPTFTGTPAGPTAAVDTSTTQLATTEFVLNQGYLKTALAGTTYAPLASPTFTGTVNMAALGYSGTSSTSSTGSWAIPSGTTNQRVAPSSGAGLRFNSTFSGFEGWNGSDWISVGQGVAGTRNRIINGNMIVAQRESDVGTSLTYFSGNYYAHVDRWLGYMNGSGQVTGQRVQGATAGQYRYQFTGGTGVTGIGFGQRIEQLNSADLAGTTVTLSADIANTSLSTVTWTAYYANTADTFGTLASPTRTQIATGTFAVNSTVTRYSTSISIPAAASTGLEIVFSVGAQTTGTWTIGNVQLEPGTVLTPFERLSYSQILQLCQRYYETSVTPLLYARSSYSVDGAACIGYAVEKRTIPAVIFFNNTATITLALNTTRGLAVQITSPLNGQSFQSCGFRAFAEL